VELENRPRPLRLERRRLSRLIDIHPSAPSALVRLINFVSPYKSKAKEKGREKRKEKLLSAFADFLSETRLGDRRYT
jgi:hypothetical protein